MGKNHLAELNHILAYCQSPAELDGHPWATGVLVQEQQAINPQLTSLGPGQQLMATITTLFAETRPATPPKLGKRVDTDWAQFGLLAALYFAPLGFGAPMPKSLRQAWGRMDESIALFLKDTQQPPEDLSAYHLTNEEDAAPVSTLSDWKNRGLETLANHIEQREQYLTQNEKRRKPSSNFAGFWKTNRGKIMIVAAVVLVLGLTWKAVRIYLPLRALLDQRQQIQTVLDLENPTLSDLVAAGSNIPDIHENVSELHHQLRPVLAITPLLRWLPTYGEDIYSAAAYMQIAEHTTAALAVSYQTAQPLMSLIEGEGPRPSNTEIVRLLQNTQGPFEDALSHFTEADSWRNALQIETLSPLGQKALGIYDTWGPQLRDGLLFAVSLPKLLGSEVYGPQTYLLLIQNEDEIRATGGFITGVGTVVIDQGQLLSMQIQDSYAVDNYDFEYPLPPWQLTAFMDAPVWVLRDANWSPDFSEVARITEHLYAYSSGGSVDGVIAIDQTALKYLLRVTGPIEVNGDQVSADNLLNYMREKRAQITDPDIPWWQQRKDFLRPLASNILDAVQNDPNISIEELGLAMVQMIEEKHTLLYVDDVRAMAAITNRGWEGNTSAPDGDFLMVVDSNIGFNKANAAIETTLGYVLDFSNPQSPRGNLIVQHNHTHAGSQECIHEPVSNTKNYDGLIARCYWNYLRVYTHADSTLLDSTPHEIPGEWMLLGETIPARTEQMVDESAVLGLNGYGTLFVLPPNQRIETRFTFQLPSTVLTATNDGYIYTLKLVKQPGLKQQKVVLAITPPAGLTVIESSKKGEWQDNQYIITFNQKVDLAIMITFGIP